MNNRLTLEKILAIDIFLKKNRENIKQIKEDIKTR